MTDTKSARDRAEEARREAIRLGADLLWTDPDPDDDYGTSDALENQHDLAEFIKAIDRYGLLARLAQAERAYDTAQGATGIHVLLAELAAERDRLKREVEEVERGK